MDGLFSERYQYVVKQTQFESLNSRTRSFIWDELYFNFFSNVQELLKYNDDSALFFLYDLTKELFSVSLIQAPTDAKQIIRQCQNAVLHSEWYITFDIIEYIFKYGFACYNDKKLFRKAIKALTKNINKVLEEEKCSYRIISNLVIPITNRIEIEAITETIILTESIRTVEFHLSKSLGFLADRHKLDYLNSIKEIILALESLLRIISKSPSAKMSEALKKLKSKNVITLNKNLENTLTSLYAWSSDEGGLRHADKGSSELIDIDDAKLTIVISCGLINYLIAKSSKAGIELSV